MKLHELESVDCLIKKYADRSREHAEIRHGKIMQTSEIVPAPVRAIRAAIVIGIFAALFVA